METALCEQEFRRRLQQQGLALSSMLPADGINAMLDYYASERAEECSLNADGDMLLYQWGISGGYAGRGRHFYLDITRQLIVGEGEDDDFFQLSLSFNFAPAEHLEAVGSSNRWCHSPSELPEFRAFILASPAFAAVGEASGGESALVFECVG